MNTQQVIDVAQTVGASNLGAPEAANLFRNALRSSIKVQVQLTSKERKRVEKLAGIPLLFENTKPVISDHPELVAVREITRQSYEKCFNPSVTGIETLVVGASSREMALYDNNPAISFYLAMKDAKDYDRVVIPALQKIAKTLKRRAVGYDPSIHTKGGKGASAFIRYQQITDLLRDYRGTHNMPDRYVTNYKRAQILLFEDSAYSFTESMFLEAFSRTGALIAYGYMMLPLELVFKDMPENSLYRITENGFDTAMTFSGGYVNGYVHKTEAWKTLLKSPVIKGQQFSLLVEVISRVGPMAIFKIVKTTSATEKIVRPLAIPTCMHFVKILDIMKSIDLKTCRRKGKLVYKSVYMSEWTALINYAFSIAEASLSPETLITYIRRVSGGVSLISSWHLGNYLQKIFIVWRSLRMFM